MSESPRFVILTHDHPLPHWDLMFEVGDALRTWRLEREPQSGVEIAAVALADHRREYLDYEGPVSGGRGTVTRWDRGDLMSFEEMADRMTAVVAGIRVRGTVTLSRTPERDAWRCVIVPHIDATNEA